MTQTNINEELLHIRKRARRRLVGAIALVMFALTVLWTVLDNTPPPQFSSGHAVEIISSAPALMPSTASLVAVVQTASAPEYLKPPVDAGEVPFPAVAPEVAPSIPASLPVSASTPLPGRLVNHQTPVKPVVVVKPKPVVASIVKSVEVDPRKILDGLDDKKAASKPATANKFYLQIGAFGDAARVAQLMSKLKSAGLPAYSEKIKTTHNGILTRIRVGPANTEARANEWRKKAEAAGVPGKVVRQPA